VNYLRLRQQFAAHHSQSLLVINRRLIIRATTSTWLAGLALIGVGVEHAEVVGTGGVSHHDRLAEEFLCEAGVGLESHTE
jgi:hypothetical protein